MIYGIFATIVMVVHAVLIGAVFLGILVGARFKRFRPIETFVLLAAIVIWSIYGGCPLTSLEDFLRIQAGPPLPISETGFIPFYAYEWLRISISNSQITAITYITAAIFLALSIEWLSPYVNFELIKLRSSARSIIHKTKAVDVK